jgi:VWFA-related protein
MTGRHSRSAAVPLLLVSFVASVSFVRAVSVVRAQAPLFRSRVDLVNLGVTVTDKKGTLVTDLTLEDFEIVEDGKTQMVRYFASGEGGAEPPAMHLGLMLDVSESMGEDMSFTKTASIKFLNTLTDAVDITVVDFDTEVRAARYSQNEFARSPRSTTPSAFTSTAPTARTEGRSCCCTRTEATHAARSRSAI